jgi:cytidylate kinase
MGIITISRGSYSKGSEIAEKLAGELGYECVSREVLLKASEDFNIPEVALNHAMRDAPSILDHIKFGKKKYIAFIRQAFLEYLQKDNIVYHGLAGQFFTTGITNVLKVRITANLEYRINVVMKRENVSKDQARQIVQNLDEARRKWSMYLYGIDTKAPELYDILLHVDCIQVDCAVDILSKISKGHGFQTTTESQNKLKDMLIAAQAYSLIVNNFPKAKVVCKNGKVIISVESSLAAEKTLSEKFSKLIKNIDGVKEVITFVIPFET